MTLKQTPPRWMFALALCQLSCSHGDGSGPPMLHGDTSTPQESEHPGACTLPSYCVNIDAGLVASQACCAENVSCGYILPALDDETLSAFPQLMDFRATLVAEDLNDKCTPESYFLGTQAGLDQERVQVENGADILVTPNCEAYHILALTLAGCCLPDDTCGVSTHLSWPTLGVLASDENAPFARPECVSASTLNQQFRDSTLGTLARVQVAGRCNHAELDHTLPRRE